MTTRFFTRVGTYAVLAITAGILCAPALRAQSGAPQYEVDPTWPNPLPDRWVIGGLGGLCVDNQDHVFILNRQDVLEGDLNAGKLAPPIIEIDSSGKLQKYSHDGSRLLLQIGKKGVLDSSDGTAKGKPLNSNAAQFFMPSSIYADPQNGDVYVSDGEGAGSNRRIAVMDRSGQFLRQWQPEGMDTVHCLSVAHDGLVYVCNRQGARLQVYDKMGKFIKNIDVPWKPYTAPADGKVKDSGGAAVSLDFSRDASQRRMYLINQNNSQIEIIDRETGKILSSFGSSGHFPGQFDQPHGIAVDSKANVYVTENRGKRVQKFKIAGQ